MHWPWQGCHGEAETPPISTTTTVTGLHLSFQAESTWGGGWACLGSMVECLRAPQLLTAPAPHIVVCVQRKQQLGSNMRLRDVLAEAVWKVTATTAEGFEDQTVCVPHSYLWPRRPPPPSPLCCLGSELEMEMEQNSEQTCGHPQANPEPRLGQAITWRTTYQQIGQPAQPISKLAQI